MIYAYSNKYINSKALQRFNNDQNFIDFFCFHSWRSIPFSAIRSINEWHNQQYPLMMMETVPSPDEVLTMQAQGSRCVSMLTGLHEICHFVGEGRDVFGFLLHDLIHADHFFRDRENAKAQIEFSKRILAVRNHPAILDMMMKDPVFVGEFHYLMSDMNSVPLHLLKAFKTVLLGFYKRRDNLAMTSTLKRSSELEFCDTWIQLLQPWCFSEQTLQAALRLNTPKHMAPDDSILLDQALRSYNNNDESLNITSE